MPDNVPNVTELTAQLVASGRQETEKLNHLKRDVLDAINSGSTASIVERFPSSQARRLIPCLPGQPGNVWLRR